MGLFIMNTYFFYSYANQWFIESFIQMICLEQLIHLETKQVTILWTDHWIIDSND